MSAKTEQYGLGEYDYGRGWFMVATSEEVTTTPIPLRFFGREMVAYRGETGTPHLVSAYCPHMGAHIGKNTTSYIVRDKQQVEGDSIRCPFHAWRFGPDGHCDDIPYSDFRPKNATIDVYRIIERAGIIWLWNDMENPDAEPDIALPEFAEYGAPGWVPWRIDLMGDLNIHPLEINDNMADYGHFVPIHGATEFVLFSNEFKGEEFHQYYGAGHRTLVNNPEDLLVLDTWYGAGPGILQSKMTGDFETRLLIANTPIDNGGQTRVWHALMVKTNDGSKKIDGAQLVAAREYAETSRFSLAQDIEIWNNKREIIHPLAVPADGPYGKGRLFFSQFYQPRANAAGIQKRLDGLIVTRDDRPQGNGRPYPTEKAAE